MIYLFKFPYNNVFRSVEADSKENAQKKIDNWSKKNDAELYVFVAECDNKQKEKETIHKIIKGTI